MTAIMGFLENIGDFFQAILDFILAVWSFLCMLVEGVFWLVSILPELRTQLYTLFGACPPFIGIFLTASLAIIVLYAVVKMI